MLDKIRSVACTINFYDRNDNDLYYKTTIVANLTMIVANLTMIVANLTMIVVNLIMIVANLALARSINYNRKVCCKLKHTFIIINYNPEPFIVQAIGWK